MKADAVRAWQDALLEEVFEAIGADALLSRHLVFKGARVLARLLPDLARQSLDLDANLTQSFLATYPDRQAQAVILQQHLLHALRRHFEAQATVRYQIDSVRVEPSPPRAHPLGWDAYVAVLPIRDLALPQVRGLPVLTLDLAAPEWLSEHSTTRLRIGTREVTAYTLERIVGEKLRAFLSSTPAHQAKTGGDRDILRVKDLADLHRILQCRPLADRAFWHIAGTEFVGACRGRGVDCAGWGTFEAVQTAARATYVYDATVATSVPFDTAWASVRTIVEQLSADGVTPFSFALPPRRLQD